MSESVGHRDEEIDWLRSPAAVRERAHAMLDLARGGKLQHFALQDERLANVAARVVRVTLDAYPDVRVIPYHSRWRHFATGGMDRGADLTARLYGQDDRAQLRTRLDLVVTSVLLDAGAGPDWLFEESETGKYFARSEGLAVASYRMFAAGGFSSDPTEPLRADAEGLAGIDAVTVARAFQVRDDNPLLGLEGRAELLQRLGEAVRSNPLIFPAPDGQLPRVGHLGDYLLSQTRAGALPASVILTAVLEGLGAIWPGRVSLRGVNLGDVWSHPQVGLVPFHKLSQWLTYSLFEPLEAVGVRITDADALTGLAEYRNGGLFVDEGVLVPKHHGVLYEHHAVGSEVVVEWRALTVALLDRVADEVRARLRLSAAALPLAKVLEGGTWSAGRQIAREKRLADGGPPIRVDSDGTVF